MRRDELEARVLAVLRHHLMEPALFAVIYKESAREMNLIRSAGSETLEASRAEIRKIDRDLDRLVDMILRGGAADRLNERMVRMEARKRELEAVVPRRPCYGRSSSRASQMRSSNIREVRSADEDIRRLARAGGEGAHV